MDYNLKMSKMLDFIAGLFVIAWAIGFLYYSLGALVHLLLLIAVALVVIRLNKEK